MNLKNNRVPKNNSKNNIFKEINNNSEKLFEEDNELRNKKESQFKNSFIKFSSESTNTKTEKNTINSTSLNLVEKIEDQKQFDDINSERERNKKSNSKKKIRKLIGIKRKIKRKTMKNGKNQKKKVNNNLNSNRYYEDKEKGNNVINSSYFFYNIFSRQLFDDKTNIEIRDNIATIMQADGTKESFLIEEIKIENKVAYYLIPLNEYISAHIFGDNDDANDVCNENENQ